MGLPVQLLLSYRVAVLACGLTGLVSCPLFSQSALLANVSPGSPARSVAGHGAFATHTYRNLFREGGHAKRAINQKIQRAFQQLFYGDSATQRLYFPAGRNADGPLAYVYDGLHQDIRSEGMSYGLMILVQLNRKAEFDALWNYALTYMYIRQPGHPAEGYFAWSLKKDGTPNAAGPAPDGEEYFATALYFAAGRWGNGQHTYDYQAWANKILTTMRHHPVRSGPTPFGVQTTGSMVNEDHKMILFVPDANGPQFTDPSYHLPAFYELWARWGPAPDRSFWGAAADTSRQYFLKATHPATGLAPDYADFAGHPVTTTFNEDSHHFAYDSWRTAMNWSVDWAWWQQAPQEPALSNRLQTFFNAQGLATYGNIYTVAGQRLGSSHAAGLVATNATASLAATHPLAKEFVEALWVLPVPTSLGERYYGGLLYMMSMLHCGGQFRVYTPRPR